MNRLATTEDYKKACGLVKSVIDTWDPYELLKNGAPSDEFEGLAASVVTNIPRITSPEDAANAISRVFSEAFGLDGFRPEDCREIGTKLFEALQGEGFIT